MSETFVGRRARRGALSPAGPSRAFGFCLTLLALGCGEPTSSGGADPDVRLSDLACDLRDDLLISGGPPPDGIPALTEPDMVRDGDPGAAYLRSDDRVLGLVLDGQARAYPHNIFWWHEIVNDRIGPHLVSITFCPLTGSSLALSRRLADRPVEFGVSGLLFANNLVMFDRRTGDLYGPQLSVRGMCAGFRGIEPRLFPLLETSWGEWRLKYPATLVVSSETGHDRDYRRYPYGDYDRIDNPRLLFPMTVDRSRPIKERVLGIRVGTQGGKGYPFGELREIGEAAAVNDTVGGRSVVILFDGTGGQTAAAYDPGVDGAPLTFKVGELGFVDEQTGSIWDVTGRAIGGPLHGTRLAPLENAYIAFWFAWRHFQPAAAVFER